MNILAWLFIALVAAGILMSWKLFSGRARTIALSVLVPVAAGLTMLALVVESAASL